MKFELGNGYPSNSLRDRSQPMTGIECIAKVSGVAGWEGKVRLTRQYKFRLKLRGIAVTLWHRGCSSDS